MRQIQSINHNWFFSKNDRETPAPVSIPHTWNASDGQSGPAEYYRGVCTYERSLSDVSNRPGETVYLEFGAVNTVADVYIDEAFVGHHEGGFSAFRFEITDFLSEDSCLKVIVDNRPNDYTYPQFADFTFFGGIYRDVTVIHVPESHFSLKDFGGSGVRIQTVTDAVTGTVNASYAADAFPDDAVIRASLLDHAGRTVAIAKAPAMAGKLAVTIKHPRLWNGKDDPYLYTLRSELLSDGEVMDHIESRIGFRSFSVDPERGFYLNGRPYPLRGVAKHQDKEDKGWATDDKDMEKDMDLILETGVNTVRCSHYQHPQYFYDLCDRTGMIVWAEIPYISNHISEASDNAVLQMTELVVQNMHHPGICFWGLSNEISMFGVNDELIRDHVTLNTLCHKLDPTRLTAIACWSMLPWDSPLLSVPDLISYNLYYGWYEGDVEDMGRWLDDFHKEHPDICLGISEYGAEGLIKWHSSAPAKGDYSEEYQAYYHRKAIEIIQERPYIWSTHLWNMFDFAASKRNEGGCCGRNNKGLVTFDRNIKKDSFYVYKAHFSKEPFVHITQKRFYLRPERRIRLEIISSLPQVEIYTDSRLITVLDIDHIKELEVELAKEGETRITAVSGNVSDEAVFLYRAGSEKEYTFDTESEISNWNSTRAMDLIRYPDDALSFHDSVNTVTLYREGEALLIPFLEEIAADIRIEKELIRNRLGSFSISRIFKLAEMSERKPDQARWLLLSNELNKIKKSQPDAPGIVIK